MNLAQPQGILDTPAAVAGDPFFLGVDERQAPNQLRPGYACAGQNVRFRRGRAETRRGVMLCPWMKDDGRTPWAEVYGGINFSDPNATGDWFIIAADGGVWKTRPNMTAQQVPLPAGVTLTTDTFVRFVANTDGGDGVLVMLRGDEADPLVCVDLDAGFMAVPAHTGGTRDMPRSAYGLNHLNRLLLIEGKDIVAASDQLAYNDFVAVQNQYRINPGNSQRLVALLPMPNRTLLCFKSQSVLQVANVANEQDGSLSGIGPDPLTDSYGIAGPDAVVRKGANAYWVTNEPSVTSLRLTELNETQDTDVRLSDALERTFNRINSLYLHLICMEVWAGKLYVALPLDDASYTSRKTLIVSGGGGGNGTYTRVDSTHFTDGDVNAIALQEDGRWHLTIDGSDSYSAESLLGPWTVEGGEGGEPAPTTAYGTGRGTCNAVAVYDFVTGAWCGVDESPGVFAIKAFFKAPFLGRTRLFILGTDGALRLYEEGFEDEVFDSEDDFAIQAITTILTTRGYALADGDRSRMLSAVCRLRTWDPSYTLRSLAQGYNDNQTELEAQTRDRTKYQAHGTEAWDEGNEAGDHGNPGREDYSVTANDPDGLNVDAAGVDCDAHQTSDDRVSLSRVGDWQQLQITNTRGRLELLQVITEQVDSERNSGVQVI